MGLFKRHEPDTDMQPYALEHIQDMGKAVPKHILSQAAYEAFYILAASRVAVADCYTHGGPKGEWVLELHGAYPWQECRFSADQWQAFYEVHLKGRHEAGKLDGLAWLTICRHLAKEYPNGQVASTMDSIAALSRKVRGESVA